MAEEELLFLVKRSFEKVKSDIKTHDAYIQALRAEIELLKMHIERLTEKIGRANDPQPVIKHNKSFIKQKILSALTAGARPLAELKELIVDHGKHCSKASFYRYIDELRLKGSLVLVETDGMAFVSVPLNATN